MRRLIAVALVLASCSVLPAHAQTLALDFRQGDAYKYSLHLSGSFSYTAINAPQTGSVKFDAKASETVTVTAVESDGTADLSVAFSKLTITTTGLDPLGGTTSTTSTQTNAIPPQQLKVAPDGRILSINGESVSVASPFGIFVGSDLAYAVLPDTAVKPGDKWSKSFDQAQPGGQTSVHVTTNSVYLRDEETRGVNAAVIETKGAADFILGLSGGNEAMKGTATTDTTSWVDPAARRVLRSTSNATMKATTSALETGVTITGTQSVDLEPA